MSKQLARILAIVTVLLSLAPVHAVGAQTPAFAHPGFQRVWERYDRPVSETVTARSWTWGPNTYWIGTEFYAESPGGRRLVQYFDKSRMEISNPRVEQSSPWYVTNGLLATELITGQLQTGDARFEPRTPAEIPVAGDPDDPGGPLYATFRNLRTAAPKRVGEMITETLDRIGNASANPALAAHGVTAAYHVAETQHTVASPFWTFLNLSGPVYEGNRTTTARLFEPTFFVTGFPITEAFWARVKVAGEVRDVLVQCYERRCLTYTPSNPEGFQVEMGNIGQHYFNWRYANNAPALREACDASYPDVCIPSPPPNLNCEDIPFRRFRVQAPDPHGFDPDRDGIGCERD